MGPRVDTSFIGSAGVFAVAAELSLRGLVALPTIRNAPGIDLLVVNPSTDWHASVQVKTSQYKTGFWLLGSKYTALNGRSVFYAFVRLLPKTSQFEVFLEPAARVIVAADAEVAASRARGNKEFAPWWPLPPEPDRARVRAQWLNFGTSYLGDPAA